MLTQSKNSDHELKQGLFPTTLFLPCGRSYHTVGRRWWVVFRVVTGKILYYCALCARPPPIFPIHLPPIPHSVSLS